MKKMRTKPLFGRGKLQKMLLVTRIGLLCILALPRLQMYFHRLLI